MFIEALGCIHTKSGAVMNAGRVVQQWGGAVGAGLILLTIKVKQSS